MKYTCDFETCTWEEFETYVWAWALCDIKNTDNLKIGNSIDDLFDILKKKSCTLYFHNLKFDGEFIIYWLLKNGFTWIKDKSMRCDKTFTTLITDIGVFYSITIYWDVNKKHPIITTIFDSLKIIPFKVEEIPKTFGLKDINKLEIDYDEPRRRGHVLTLQEREYIKNDVVIVAKALKILFDAKLTSMTAGANALKFFKDMFSKKRNFDVYFPKIDRETYEELRKSYKGGFTYLNPIYKNLTNGKTYNLDVNSLYPSRMRICSMPIGEPIHYEGCYIQDNIYPLYIQRFVCSFKIKKNKTPTIQLKNSNFFLENEYVESTNGEIETLTLSSIDLKLFMEHYDVDDLKYIDGWKFKSFDGIFDEYIDYWIEIKNKATIEHNKGMRTLAKLELNSLYGKFATSMKSIKKMPYLENDVVKYKNLDEEEKKGLYIPIGIFITAYARDLTIRTSQKIKEYSINKYGRDMYIYSDTDSIKTLLPIEELKQFCEIDDVKLGAWKFEGVAVRSKFIRQKTYLEEFEEDGKSNLQITCCGMPSRCYKYVTWDNFRENANYPDKLRFSHVKGGVKLVKTEFTIKANITSKKHL